MNREGRADGEAHETHYVVSKGTVLVCWMKWRFELQVSVGKQGKEAVAGSFSGTTLGERGVA